MIGMIGSENIKAPDGFLLWKIQYKYRSHRFTDDTSNGSNKEQFLVQFGSVRTHLNYLNLRFRSFRSIEKSSVQFKVNCAQLDM